MDVTIGIDCGATTCRIAVRRDGVITTREGPGGNATSDVDGCAAAIVGLVADMGGGALHHAPTHAAVAGVVDAASSEALRIRLPFTRIEIADERRAALRGALGAGDGALAALGTGSFVALQTDGAMRATGGYGLVLGDEASGAWIGREALAHGLRAGEGLEAETALGAALVARLGGPAGAMRFAAGATPRDLAGLAPDVMAAPGDPLAQAVLGRGAAYVTHALAALGWTSALPLVLTGGVAPIYPALLGEEIAAAIVPARGTTLDGALALAGELP